MQTSDATALLHCPYIPTSNNSTIDGLESNIPLPKLRYLIWKGNHNFFCNGGVMMGPHVQYFVCSVMLISSTWFVYLSLVVPFLHSRSFFISGLVFWTIHILTLCLTAFTVGK